MPDLDSSRASTQILDTPERAEQAWRPEGLPKRSEGNGGHRGLILLVEDDQGDQLLTREALSASGRANRLVVVSDGEEALHYLRRTGRYQDPAEAPRPDLILLDLNMPKVSGRQVAAEAKTDPDLRTIPIVVLSTSDYREDVARCYQLGVNSYVHKPTSFDAFVETIGSIEHYWLSVVEPPVDS